MTYAQQEEEDDDDEEEEDDDEEDRRAETLGKTYTTITDTPK